MKIICQFAKTGTNGAEDTVYRIVQMANGYVRPILGPEDIDGTFKGLYLRYKKQVDSKNSREALRLMQLVSMKSRIP